MSGLTDQSQRKATRVLTMREAILEGISEEMDENENVIVIGQDVRAFGGPLKSTEGLWERFGSERVHQMPICESTMTSIGVGLAFTGMRPIVEIMFTDLLPVAAVPLIQLASNLRYLSAGGEAPMVIRARGGDGPYRSHPQNYEALFAHSPGLTIVFPSTPTDGKGLIKSAIRSNDPVLFIENIFLYNAPKAEVAVDLPAVPLRSARIARSGTDLTLVTYGRAVRTAVTAATQLADEGLEVEVIDLRTVHPWDEVAVLQSVSRTQRLLVVHEAWRQGGIGAEIVARAAEQGNLVSPPRRIGAASVPIPWAEPLRDALIPTSAEIVAAARAICG
jgi:pyruvate/2-oxoglutarate/acetoin dehydrogenase E1 component